MDDATPPLDPAQTKVVPAPRVPTPAGEGLMVLSTASAEELEFLVMFARHYVGGRKVLCWMARGVVAVGMICGAVAGILALAGQLRVFNH